jgi:hypothetical protein
MAELEPRTNIKPALHKFTVVAVCKICGEKRRTVLSIIAHILEEHE